MSEKKKINYKKTFPVFVLGFVGMSVLRTLGVFPVEAVSVLKTTASFLIVTAIAGVGLGTDFSSMRKMGLKPFYAGLTASVLMALVSFALISFFVRV